MSRTIKCIAHYDVPNNTEPRNCAPAACTKLDYVYEVAKKNGCRLSVLSVAGTRGQQALSAKTMQIDEMMDIEWLPHGGRGHKIKNIVSELVFRRRMRKRLDSFVQDGDTVLAYHSPSLINALTHMKKKKKFTLILEVEEIYGDVEGNVSLSEKECAFFSCADAFITPTALLNQKVNIHQKPFAVSHGTYHVEPLRDDVGFNDDAVHCLYAGTLDPCKGGGFMAIEAAAFLPSGYHMHILGFGTEAQLDEAKKRIADISRTAACKLTYDGVLKGEAYFRFLQSCHIGLSTHDPQGKFNDTSFPSKILSYMANGLRVVSAKTSVVLDTVLSPYMSYYDSQSPEEVADAILSVDMTAPYDSRRLIQDLDDAFVKDIEALLEQTTPLY